MASRGQEVHWRSELDAQMLFTFEVLPSVQRESNWAEMLFRGLVWHFLLAACVVTAADRRHLFHGVSIMVRNELCYCTYVLSSKTRGSSSSLGVSSPGFFS